MEQEAGSRQQGEVNGEHKTVCREQETVSMKQGEGSKNWKQEIVGREQDQIEHECHLVSWESRLI